MFTTIVKVLGLSVLMSIAIKYGGPLLPVTATTLNVWIAVLVPSGVLAIVLAWRWQTAPTHPPLGK